MPKYILSIDQGTTSSRAMIFNDSGTSIAKHQIELKLNYPQNGWVECDPLDIWEATLSCCKKAIAKANITVKEIIALGISNQRETTILWDKDTGKPIYNAIVWQDRRTTERCEVLAQQDNIEEILTAKTGLLIDPYFSATKIEWILDNVENAREAAQKGRIAFGTVDTYLLWHLTGGNVHATDATNASRTLLFNIHTQEWDKELLALFNIPSSILPQVKDSADNFGSSEESLLNYPIPITGIAGDQQAALIGQACFKPGMIKSTYGTGCFMLLNTGKNAIRSQHRLLTTIAYRFNGKVNYGLEGSIFIAGAAIQWLRDTLHLIQNASDTQDMAISVKDNGGVYLVPAFTGLGAPYWDPNARGALLGLTRDTSIEHIARAALEAVAYQSNDLMQAMQKDGANFATLRVDGGMVANNWLLQFLADILRIPVERPACIESSAQGAAYLAALGAGLYKSLEEITSYWQLEKQFLPNMYEKQRSLLCQGWSQSVTKL